MKVSVVIPWKLGSDDFRLYALRWTLKQWATTTVRRVVLAEGGDPWVKACAVMPAVEKCPAGRIVVMADADVWSDGIVEAIRQVEDGAAWAVPHRRVIRLNRQATSRVAEGASPSATLGVDQPPYQGIAGGGVVVARREVMMAVPLDPRFVGWGQEDWSWGVALHTLVGPGWQGDADLFHLWHPPQDRTDRKRGTAANMALMRRYRNANGIPERMERLVAEARDALDFAPPAVHDHA